MNSSLVSVINESAMLDLGRDFAAQILANTQTPASAQILASHQSLAVFELIGDVGTGKTTFTRGLAAGLGVTEPVTSPSFTISKRYAFPLPPQTTTTNVANAATPTADTPADTTTGQLIHYDFYRLDDPGIMRDELAEALTEPNSVIVVEWGGGIADLLPTNKTRLELTLLEDGSRSVKIITSANPETPVAETVNLSPVTKDPRP